MFHCCVDSIEIDRKNQIISQAVRKYAHFDLISTIAMDCRYSNSDGMKLLRSSIEATCTSLQSKLSISLNSHMLLVYLIDKHSSEFALTLEKIQAELEVTIEKSKKHRDILPFIPKTIPRLVEICVQLIDKGHILFLLNETSSDKSFIIIDKAAVLTDIIGTIFAPIDFKEHCQLAADTGVVPQSKLVESFKKYDIKMLTELLVYLELAISIDNEEVVELINETITPKGQSFSHSYESFLFCPALIRLTVASAVFKFLPALPHHFGWILSCVDGDHFFNPRFLHVLILRLASTFGFTPKLAPSQGGCSVWKTGVCWCTFQGVKVLVDVLDKKQVVALVQAHSFLLLFLSFSHW